MQYNPPVEENQIIKAKCIALGNKGDGIFKHEKYVIIVPDTEPDKEYEIKITKVLRRVGFGEVVK